MDALNDHKSKALWVTPEHWQQMRTDVDQRAPEEACGIVAGKDWRSLKVFPATNVLHSSVRYRMDPKEQLQILNTIDEQNWELLAIYHSHPHGPLHPSLTDIQEAYYPEAVYLIWAQARGVWNCKGFNIHAGRFSEVPVNIT